MEVTQFLILALLIESIVTLLRTVYVHDETKPFLQRINTNVVLSLVVGESVAFAFSADIVPLLGLPSAVYPVGPIITGLIIGRGSNFVHDILSLVRSIKTGNAQK